MLSALLFLWTRISNSNSVPYILTFEVSKQSIGILLCRVCLKSSIVMAGVLFEDIFNVKDIDPTGKQFDRGKCFVMYIVIALIEILWDIIAIPDLGIRFKHCYWVIGCIIVPFLILSITVYSLSWGYSRIDRLIRGFN